MNGTRHREVGEYLARLERSMADLPAVRRDEILVEIDEHISELLAENPRATDAEIRNALERVGDPEDIAAEARDRLEISPVTRFRRPETSWTDIAAVTLLVLGSVMIFLFSRPEGMLVAWVAAVPLLWISEVWRTRDKTRVTLVVSAGAFSALLIPGAGDEGFVYFAIILFAAIWPPAYLGLKLRQAHADIAGDAQAPSEPARTDTSRTTRRLIGGVLAAVVLAAVVLALLWTSGGDDPPLAGDAPRITQAQFDQVNLGDSKDDVVQMLGGSGHEGSIVTGLDPQAREEPEDVGDQQFDDCWSYSLTRSGVGAGSDAAVCFDSSDAVVYTRVRMS